MSSPWTAAEISAYDQDLAAADRQIDLLAAALKIGIAEAGEPQAMASMMVMIRAKYGPGLPALLMAALKRLAADLDEPEDSSE